MSSKQKTKSTQTKDPYAPAVPGLTSAASGITNWMNSGAGSQVYQGDRVTPMSGQTDAGLDALYNSTGGRATEGFLTDTLDGKYLDQGNPYMTQLLDSIRARVMPGINSRVSAAGMAPGSSVDQGLVSREMTNATAQPLFQAYEAERQRQMQAAGMLPGVSRDIAANMIGAGQAREGYDQKDLDADRQKFEEEKYAGLQPYAAATPLLSTIGNAGGTSQSNSTTTTSQNPISTIAGLGMMGAGLMTGMPGLGMMGAGGMTMPGTAANGGWSTTVNPTQSWKLWG